VNIPPARDVISEAGTMPTVCDEAGIGPTADNATYCHGVQPITIEPMDIKTESNDVEPIDVESTSTPAAHQHIPDAVARPGAPDPVTRPAMRVVYCGTVSGEQLLQQSTLGQLAPNIAGTSNSSAPAPNVRIPSNVTAASTADGSRMAVTVQRRSLNVSSPSRAKQPGSHPAVARTSDTGSSTGHKSTSKVRRAQSLDSEPVAVLPR